MTIKLYVGNLSYQVSEAEVRELFVQVGSVESVKIIMDAYTSRSRGFGFVEMATREDGQKAIEQLTGTPLKGRPIIVNEARPQERRSSKGTGAQRPSEGSGNR